MGFFMFTECSNHYERTFVEQVAGTAEGGAFDRTRHVTILSFVNTDGLPWPAGR